LSEREEIDRLDGFDHPRETSELFGHEAAEEVLLSALRAGRLHHAWLITGPKGIGKATLAYRLARFVLRYGTDVPAEAQSLYLSPSDPVFSRVAAEGHGDLLVLRRPFDEKSKKFKRDLTVDEVRRLTPFFGKQASEGGWRVAIIDCADDMNNSAANALLKNLEEPPDNSIILLVTHNPGTQLATIRSRCRTLQLAPLETSLMSQALATQLAHAGEVPLGEADRMAIAHLSGGSLGHGLELTGGGGLEIYRDLMSLIVTMPNPDMQATHSFAARFSGKKGEAGWGLFGELLTGFLTRLARGMAANDFGEVALDIEGEALSRLATLAPANRWIDCWERSAELIERCGAVNLDRRMVTLNILFEIQTCGSQAA
jgi:DNA polymerase-3 subunit delta'